MTYDLNPFKRMQRCSLFRISSALVFVFSLFFTSAFAQPHLERISKAERSDGLGYVVRYHLSATVDSFTVIQPAPDLIQMELFANEIDTSGIQIFEQDGKIQYVRLYKLEGSYGVDIYLDPNISVTSQAYTDQNGIDILLALSKADPHDVEVFTQQFIANNWYLGANPEEALVIESIPTPPIDPDADYNQVRDKLKFDTIVIDAGHGGHDPGNLGYRKRSKEKDIVLSIALKLGEYINEYLPDVKVIYTRDKDTFVQLEERGRIANRSEADLFVSIHADAWTSSQVYGSSVFFLGLNRSDLSLEIMKEENQVFNTHGVIEDLTEEDLLIYELAHSGIISTSERISYMVEDQLRSRAGRKSRGVKQMGLVVLYQASMPGILVETGFLTNPSEQRFLSSDYGQSIMASAIFRAIRDYKVEYEKTEAFSSSN
tara:strand:+ start:44509 stop:45795 length:1287 start_codon:yes stop_codon:yes gene_type:complete